MRVDQHKKPKIYGLIGVQEYYLFDPTQEYLEDGPFVAFHWLDGKFVEQDVSSNHFYSPALNLDLVVHDGLLRLVDSQTGLLLKTPAEEANARQRAEAKLAESESEVRRLRQELDALKRLAQSQH